MTTEQEQMVDSVIERFDWDKVVAYMTLVNWKHPFNEPLTKEAIKKAAAQDFRFLYKGFYESGGKVNWLQDEYYGLVASVSQDGRPHLFFYIEHKTNTI